MIVSIHFNHLNFLLEWSCFSLCWFGLVGLLSNDYSVLANILSSSHFVCFSTCFCCINECIFSQSWPGIPERKDNIPRWKSQSGLEAQVWTAKDGLARTEPDWLMFCCSSRSLYYPSSGIRNSLEIIIHFVLVTACLHVAWASKLSTLKTLALLIALYFRIKKSSQVLL